MLHSWMPLPTPSCTSATASVVGSCGKNHTTIGGQRCHPEHWPGGWSEMPSVSRSNHPHRQYQHQHRWEHRRQLLPIRLPIRQPRMFPPPKRGLWWRQQDRRHQQRVVPSDRLPVCELFHRQRFRRIQPPLWILPLPNRRRTDTLSYWRWRVPPAETFSLGGRNQRIRQRSTRSGIRDTTSTTQLFEGSFPRQHQRETGKAS